MGVGEYTNIPEYSIRFAPFLACLENEYETKLAKRASYRLHSVLKLNTRVLRIFDGYSVQEY